MKFSILLFLICLLNPRISNSQSYFNEVYNIDDHSILMKGLIVNNERILICYEYLDPETLLDRTGFMIRKGSDVSKVEFEIFNSSRSALLELNDDILLMYERLPSSDTEVGFKILDQDLSEKYEFSYSLSGMQSGNVSSTTNGQNVFLASVNFLANNQWDTNVMKLDNNKEIEWSLDFGDSKNQVFPRDIEICTNDDIILSTTTFFDGEIDRNGQLYRISPYGDVLWEYTNETTSSGTIQYYAIELTNGNIVQSTELDIPIFGQYRYPPS